MQQPAGRNTVHPWFTSKKGYFTSHNQALCNQRDLSAGIVLSFRCLWKVSLMEEWRGRHGAVCPKRNVFSKRQQRLYIHKSTVRGKIKTAVVQASWLFSMMTSQAMLHPTRFLIESINWERRSCLDVSTPRLNTCQAGETHRKRLI